MIKTSRRSIIIALVALIMLWLCLIGFKIVYKYSGKSDIETFEYNRNIELELVANISDFFISPAQGDKITIKSDRAGGITTRESDNTITVEQSDRKLFAAGYITVEIPSTINKLSIRTNKGDIDIASIEADELYAETISGDISILNIKSNNTKAKAEAGDIEISNSITENAISLSTATGDIEVSYCTYAKLNASTGVGDIELSLNDKNGTISYEAKSLSDVDIFDYEYRKSSDTIAFGNGKPIITLSTENGDIEVST